MIEYLLRYPSYPMWDYEVDLARREVLSLTGLAPESIADGVRIVAETPLDVALLRRLTFFHEVTIRNGHAPETFGTYQALKENTAKLGRNADRPSSVQMALTLLDKSPVGRKESRYISHGIHDYKGKFYPQLAKALLTWLGARAGDVVLDPFGGSGTTLVECYLANMVGLSVDLNPLAHLIAQAKVSCLALPAEVVIEETESLLERINDAFLAESSGEAHGMVNEKIIESPPLPYSRAEIDYLSSWFAPSILGKLFLLLRDIECVEYEPLRNLYRVVLSNILRDCSQQEPRDLRIRRRQTPLVDAPVIARFRSQLLETTNRLIAFLWSRESCGVTGTYWECHLGDARNLASLQSRYFARPESVDTVLTSPPYATALPYLDTQRLSLAFLRLTAPRGWLRLDKEMIGNREIRPTDRAQAEQEFLENYNTCPLPSEVKELILNVHGLNQTADVGFRRKNMAALLYQYFSDMRLVMSEVNTVLKPGGLFALVVGNNMTTAGGKLVEIKTDRYLGLIGQSLGLHLVEQFPITVTTEDLAHSKNAIRENSVIVLEKSSGVSRR